MCYAIGFDRRDWGTLFAKGKSTLYLEERKQVPTPESNKFKEEANARWIRVQYAKKKIATQRKCQNDITNDRNGVAAGRKIMEKMSMTRSGLKENGFIPGNQDKGKRTQRELYLPNKKKHDSLTEDVKKGTKQKNGGRRMTRGVNTVPNNRDIDQTRREEVDKSTFLEENVGISKHGYKSLLHGKEGNVLDTRIRHGQGFGVYGILGLFILGIWHFLVKIRV